MVMERVVRHPVSGSRRQSFLFLSASFCSATNDLLLDMQNQMRNNDCHIGLLRKQNESLKDSTQQLMYHSPTEPADEQKKASSRRYSHGNDGGTTVSITDVVEATSSECLARTTTRRIGHTYRSRRRLILFLDIKANALVFVEQRDRRAASIYRDQVGSVLTLPSCASV